MRKNLSETKVTNILLIFLIVLLFSFFFKNELKVLLPRVNIEKAEIEYNCKDKKITEEYGTIDYNNFKECAETSRQIKQFNSSEEKTNFVYRCMEEKEKNIKIPKYTEYIRTCKKYLNERWLYLFNRKILKLN